jgi:DNA-binding MarR family transcriptional regulator
MQYNTVKAGNGGCAFRRAQTARRTDTGRRTDISKEGGMTEEHRKTVNDFFVNVFNKILLYEEQALNHFGCGDLSVREMHVLEAVECLEAEACNTMSHIAARLFISVGALTTSVNVLVRKGYLSRESGAKDRRLVYVMLTEQGRQAADYHRKFHEQMVQSLESRLDKAEWDALTRSLTTLGAFFRTEAEKGREA